MNNRGERMKAMAITRIAPMGGTPSLEPMELPRPEPGRGQILLQVATCGVCHTEIDEIEGRTPPPRLPMVPGHQVVGRVARLGEGVVRFREGDRVGVAWIHSACGRCLFCRRGEENLCLDFVATGRDVQGGYAEYMAVPAAFAFSLPESFPDALASPLLCAGAVGYRSLRLTGLEDGEPLALVGFGASAHLVIQAARGLYPASPIYVFARSEAERRFALDLGAAWSGDHECAPPAPFAAAIDTTPAWKPILEALRFLQPGGRLVINAIRKEAGDRDALLGLDYALHLWREKELKSVANVTRRDVEEFLGLADRLSIRPEVEEFSLEDANRALLELKARKIRGAKVLVI